MLVGILDRYDNAEETSRSLREVDIDYFLEDGKCWLETLDGVLGFIRLEDAVTRNLTVHVPLRGTPLVYETVEGVVRAGWRLVS